MIVRSLENIFDCQAFRKHIWLSGLQKTYLIVRLSENNVDDGGVGGSGGGGDDDDVDVYFVVGNSRNDEYNK